MIRILFIILAAIPIFLVVLSAVYEPSFIDHLENNKSYVRGAYAFEGQWFVAFTFILYLFLFKMWRRLRDFDYDTNFSFLMLFAINKKFRKFEVFENIVKDDYRKLSNGVFPQEQILEKLDIKGSFYREVSYDEIIIIVKCQSPNMKPWYSLHFIGNNRNIIFANDRKSLINIVKKFSIESKLNSEEETRP
jgi:hypothetical protein